MATLAERERQEKIARAKAKLKRHQDKQGSNAGSRPGSVGVPSPTASDPVSLPSITDELPPPSPAAGKHMKLASEVPDSLFGAASSPHDAFFAPSSPPRAASIPEAEEIEATPSLAERAMTILSPASTTMSLNSTSLGSPESSKALSVHQQTIKLLVSEKGQLLTQLEQLQKQLDEREAAAQTARASADDHLERLKELETSLMTEKSKIDNGERTRADLQERLSTLEREASLAKKSALELQESLDDREASIATLQAELAADTKVSDLEGRLKTKTAHADNLETEISKLRTAYNKLKADRDSTEEEIRRSRQALQAAETIQKEREEERAKLQAELAAASSSLAAAKKAAEAHNADISALRTLSDTARSDHETAKQELGDLRIALGNAQDSLNAAEGRAAQAMSRRDGLQTDNDVLMVQVNELREKTIALSNDLVAAKDRHDTTQRTLRERDADLSKSRTTEEDMLARLQALEADLAARDRALTSARERAERAEHDAQCVQDDAGVREKEIAQLREKLTKADAEVARFKTGAEARVSELHGVQAELEALRADLDAEKEEKSRLEADMERMQESSADLQYQIEELRQRGSSPEGSRAPSIRAFGNGSSTEASSANLSPTYSRNMSPAVSRDSLSPNDAIAQARWEDSRQSAELEASITQSRIRTLEDQAFAEQSRSTGLLKQVNQLEATVAALEAQVSAERERAAKAMREAFSVGAAGPYSPLPTPTRAPNTNLLTPSHIGPLSGGTTPTITASFGGHRRSRTEIPTGSVNGFPFPLPSPTSHHHPPIPISAPPKRASHARRVSLHLLKSRMEDELGLPDISLVSATPEIPSMNEEAEEGRFSGEYRHHRRPRAQLGDDIVWCACCKGDLLVVRASSSNSQKWLQSAQT